MMITLSKPVLGEMLSEEDKNKPKEYSTQEITDMVAHCRRKGMSERAIVAIKQSLQWQTFDVHNWGFVDSFVYSKQNKILKVVTRLGEEYFSPDQLYLVHKGMEWNEIRTHINSVNGVNLV